jgi:hypothetical protein
MPSRAAEVGFHRLIKQPGRRAPARQTLPAAAASGCQAPLHLRLNPGHRRVVPLAAVFVWVSASMLPPRRRATSCKPANKVGAAVLQRERSRSPLPRVATRGPENGLGRICQLCILPVRMALHPPRDLRTPAVATGMGQPNRRLSCSLSVRSFPHARTATRTTRSATTASATPAAQWSPSQRFPQRASPAAVTGTGVDAVFAAAYGVGEAGTSDRHVEA